MRNRCIPILPALSLFAGMITPAFAQAPTTPPVMKPWQIPQSSLYFKLPEQDKWSDLPQERREWLPFGSIMPDMVRNLDTYHLQRFGARGRYDDLLQAAQAEPIRTSALQLLKDTVQDEWLPPADFITPALRTFESKRPAYEVAHSAYEKGDIRAIYHLSLAGEMWLYFEQAPGQAPLKPETFLRPEFFQAFTSSRPAFASDTFSRQRAYSPGGEYQPVQILLIRVALSQAITVNGFGYPGTVKP